MPKKKSTKKVNHTTEKITEFLETGPHTVREVSTSIKKNPHTVDQALTRMRVNGKVSRRKVGSAYEYYLLRRDEMGPSKVPAKPKTWVNGEENAVIEAKVEGIPSWCWPIAGRLGMIGTAFTMEELAMKILDKLE